MSVFQTLVVTLALSEIDYGNATLVVLLSDWLSHVADMHSLSQL